jgi:hypothetical protein
MLSPYVFLLLLTLVGVVFPPLLLVAIPADILFVRMVMRQRRKLKEQQDFQRWYIEKSRYVS